MNSIDVRVADLTGAALDWAVAKATGAAVSVLPVDNPDEKWQVQRAGYPHGPFWPSLDWSQCGPMIADNQVYLEPPHDVHRSKYDEKTGKIRGCWQTYESWHATVSGRVRTLPAKIEGFPGRVGRGEGDTALIAACRAIVASHFDEFVSVPTELVQP